MEILDLSLLWKVALLLCTFVSLLWVIQRFTKNAAIIDVAWAGGIAGAALYYALMAPGDPVRRAVAATIALLWGGRIALYVLVTRVIGQPEEGRYVQLREDWKPIFELKLWFFFIAQALLAVLFSVPFWVMSQNAARLSSFEWAAALLCGVAFFGEALADAQLHRFRMDPQNKGRVCEVGLWNYSRHPNYFFEWLIWCAIALLALASPGGWLAIVCPLLIWIFIWYVTGIPATEAQALRSRGEVYRRYQKTTSVFFPWVKRKVV